MLVDRFLDHLAYEKRCSVHTVDAYRRDLQQFNDFLGEFGLTEPEAATDKLVRGFMMRLIEQGTAPRSVNRKLSALRGFFRFARLTGSATSDPTALIDPSRTSKRLPEFVEEKRMDRLLDEVQWPEGYTGKLHQLVLELLYGTGMRLAELLGLSPIDIDLPARSIKVLGKRNKERIIPLSDRLVHLLSAYATDRATIANSDQGPLLIDARGEPLSRRSVQRLVSYYLGQVTTQHKRSPHVLRHSFATHMLEHGADLNAVKEILGHAGLAATQVYTHNTVDKLRKVHAQAHPRGGKA